MRTNYNDSSGRNNGRYTKRQNNGGRRSSGSGVGKRNPGQHSSNGSINIPAMTSTRNKYLDMAKEALMNGNRIEAENYYQHAEHYSKVLIAAAATRREREEFNNAHNHRNNHETIPAVTTVEKTEPAAPVEDAPNVSTDPIS